MFKAVERAEEEKKCHKKAVKRFIDIIALGQWTNVIKPLPASWFSSSQMIH